MDSGLPWRYEIEQELEIVSRYTSPLEFKGNLGEGGLVQGRGKYGLTGQGIEFVDGAGKLG